MTDIFAARPSRLGHHAHLYVPGYRPGKKRRSCENTSPLCGSQNFRVDPAAAVPLSQALESWANPDSGTDLRDPLEWEWCRPCIGHAVALAGRQHAVLSEIATRQAVQA